MDQCKSVVSHILTIAHLLMPTWVIRICRVCVWCAVHCQQIVDACTAGGHDSICSKSHCPHSPPIPSPFSLCRRVKDGRSSSYQCSHPFCRSYDLASKAWKTHSRAGPRLAEPVTDSASFSPAVGDWQNARQGLPHVGSSRALSGALPCDPTSGEAQPLTRPGP